MQKYLPELRTKADLVVLLAHTGIETAQFLADDLPVDVVVDVARVSSQRERQHLSRSATLLNADVRFADVARTGTSLHDPAKLAAVLDSIRASDAVMPSSPTVPTLTARAANGEPSSDDREVTARGDDR